MQFKEVFSVFILSSTHLNSFQIFLEANLAFPQSFQMKVKKLATRINIISKPLESPEGVIYIDIVIEEFRNSIS
jgi:hypothetical protein